MFGLFNKSQSPEDRSKALAEKLLAQVNDCANDIRIMWKGKNPSAIFPATMAALGSLAEFLSAQGGGAYTRWADNATPPAPQSEAASAYDQGAIGSLIDSHLGHLTKIVDKHERECAKNSLPAAGFLPDFVGFVSALKDSVAPSGYGKSEDDSAICAAYVAEVAKSLNEQAPLMVDQITRLDGANTDGQKLLVYEYTVVDEPTAKNIDWAAAESGLRQGQLEMIKSDRDFVGVIKLGVETRYRYKNSAGETLLEFAINSSHV